MIACVHFAGFVNIPLDTQLNQFENNRARCGVVRLFFPPLKAPLRAFSKLVQFLK